MSEEKLIGWMIFVSCQEEGATIPDLVHEQLLAKGWVDEKQEITDAGAAVCDLNAEEWGVESPWEIAEVGDED